MTPPILDMTAGSRMFWWDKHDSRAIFVDKRSETYEVPDRGKMRTIEIAPDVQIDWEAEDLPFPDKTFRLVVFDPPHLIRAGKDSWLARKYGKLDDGWPHLMQRGFDEAMRVLKPSGVLIFKWNDDQIKLSQVLKEIPYRPLFGDKRSKTHWLFFMREEK